MEKILIIENGVAKLVEVNDEVLEEVNGYVAIPGIKENIGETITPIIKDYSIKQQLHFKGTSKHLTSELTLTIRVEQDYLNLEDKFCMLKDIQELLDNKYAKFEKGYD